MGMKTKWFSLLHTGAEFITKWDRVITNWSRFITNRDSNYKSGQLLQIDAQHLHYEEFPQKEVVGGQASPTYFQASQSGATKTDPKVFLIYLVLCCPRKLVESRVLCEVFYNKIKSWTLF